MTNLAIIITVIFVIVLLAKVVDHLVVLDYESAVQYRRGKYRGVVGPGSYWFNPIITHYKKFDLRHRTESLKNQETMTSDGVMTRVALDAIFKISDPVAATHTSEDYVHAFRAELQNAFRKVITAARSETLIPQREALAAQIERILEPKARDLGLKVVSVYLKDTDFPIRSKGKLYPRPPSEMEDAEE